MTRTTLAPEEMRKAAEGAVEGSRWWRTEIDSAGLELGHMARRRKVLRRLASRTEGGR